MQTVAERPMTRPAAIRELIGRNRKRALRLRQQAERLQAEASRLLSENADLYIMLGEQAEANPKD